MEFGMHVLIYFSFVSAFLGGKVFINAQKCDFQAIFNFGDSNSETGGEVYKFPYGMTNGKVFKRASDGRLIIDFIAESLGLPYLNGSMDTKGTSFKYGANFANSGQRINPDPDPVTPHNWDHPLDEQVSRFFAFKSSAIASKGQESTNMYPNPEVFSEALYTIDIGQNDVNCMFGGKPISTILDYFTNSVKRLLNDGAKYMWIHNTGPLGCTPYAKAGKCTLPFQNCSLDNIGCKLMYNEMSQSFNLELTKRVHELRQEYPKAVITLVDMYTAKYNLISNNKGFVEDLRFKYCCGYGKASCAIGGACKDPSKFISWDGMHYTEAANKIIADQIIRGDFSEPRVSISNACHRG